MKVIKSNKRPKQAPKKEPGKKEEVLGDETRFA